MEPIENESPNHLHSTLASRSRNLVGDSSKINSIDFSDDGMFLASGGYDFIVRLWPMNNAAEREIVPIQMETKHEDFIMCLVMSPTNSRVFSACRKGKVLIHDVQTSA